MKTTQILIGLIVLLAIGCGGAQHEVTPQRPPVAVKVAKAAYSGDGMTIHASGKIEAKRSANLSTRMMGNVSTLNVKVGDQVTKGTLLLVLNSRDLVAKQAQVEAGILQAESGFMNARKDYERFQSLFEKGSASEKELENITTRYEMAKAGLQAAQEMKKEVEAQFTYTHIRAPFDGVISNTFVKTGDMANPGMPLVSVEGLNQYQATVMVPETAISQVSEGLGASVRVKSLGHSYSGKVIEVSKSAKNTGGQFLVKIDLPGADEVLPGMFVNAQLDVSGGSVAQTLRVPEQVLIRQGQLTGIYTVDDRQNAILRWLRVGKSHEGQVEVLSGLSPGETYIITAESKLFNGAKVSY